jgi:hypothetical protein
MGIGSQQFSPPNRADEHGRNLLLASQVNTELCAAVIRKTWSSRPVVGLQKVVVDILRSQSTDLNHPMAMNSSIAMVPVASCSRVWSTLMAISVPGTSSPSTRWASKILVARFLAI